MLQSQPRQGPGRLLGGWVWVILPRITVGIKSMVGKFITLHQALEHSSEGSHSFLLAGQGSRRREMSSAATKLEQMEWAGLKPNEGTGEQRRQQRRDSGQGEEEIG